MDYTNLFIFEMANNHQGSLEHAKNIIDAMAKIAKDEAIKAAVKLQYRELDTFIHPDYQDRQDVKHIPRFTGTRLSDEEMLELVNYTKESGLLSVVTPFDEASVQKCIEHKIDIIKIASCSADDWPLLDRISQSALPIIASTGGLPLGHIDKLVHFFRHREREMALMHCVAIYPTPLDKLNLNFLSKLIKRYPWLTIGYSGHEAPNNLLPGQIAIAKGAQMLERHVGLPTDEITLNAYSMNPEETRTWIKAIKASRQTCGRIDDKEITDTERLSLLSLKRGVFAKSSIKKGQVIHNSDVFFAMPAQDGQLLSGELGQYRTEIIASKDYQANEAVYEELEKDPYLESRAIIHEYLGMLNEAGISLNENCTMELSHHYGLENFRQTGCFILNFFNREYCKKLILLLPGQSHPNHMHKKKEETFHLYCGDLKLFLDGQRQAIKKGEQVLIKRNTWHQFSTRTGCIFEEISTTHHKNDSYYEDKKIARLDLIQRKTFIDEW